MTNDDHSVGIDIGALYLKAVRLDSAGQVTRAFYRRHQGEIEAVLRQAVDDLGVEASDTLGCTGSAAARLADRLGDSLLDTTACQIEAVTRSLAGIQDIIDIGGGSVSLVQLDDGGRFQGYATNSMCAAGTGSFLDEQANRLGIDHDDMRAFGQVEDPPTIATRCSVFAKSDLIHRQQEGCTKAEMWSGLCRGMTRTLLGTLLSGRPLTGATAIIGGVALNQEVLRWLERAYPGLIHVPADPHLAAATGAALLGVTSAAPLTAGRSSDAAAAGTLERVAWPLTMERSRYPSFETAESHVDDLGNEVRVISWETGAPLTATMGIDVGSTSTKLALIDDQGRVVVDIYRKTGGDPIGATKLLFAALQTLHDAKGAPLDIIGVGTTGSGRKIVGKVIGADAIINEISAHVAGAVATDPTVDTIFEIGGQDSKYMHIVDGHIRDANMNYVCAAGTGSFVEEQANKLGYRVADVGPAILARDGLHPPCASDRCTVFMEQDVTRLIQQGASPEEALSAVLVSVAKNYLNKVVGNRYRSRTKIFFQGATARNQALVAAFERVLGVEVVVSPYCHVMGSFGVALLTRQLLDERADATTSFRGLDLQDREITLRKETCTLCQNDCTITYADLDGVEPSPSWGYMCGRDPEETRMRVNPHARALRLRNRLWKQAGSGVAVPENAPVVGIPRALATYTYLPLWHRFFNELGYRIQLSKPTSPTTRETGVRIAGADFCFPAKVALGHVAELATAEGVDFVFLPQMVNEVPKAEVTASAFCPWVQGWPAYSRSALTVNGMETSRILTPVVDRRMTDSKLLENLSRTLAGPLGVSARQIRRAWLSGLEAQTGFDDSCREAGAEILAEARERGEKLLVLVGRPYNSFDEGLNLGLPTKMAEYGRTILPLEFLGADLGLLGPRYANVFWSYGQKILATIERVVAHEDLDAVYLTNFSCGPDSFLLSYAEEIAGNHPFLALELDEHGADTGYLTRIEAFFDVLGRPRETTVQRRPYRPEPVDYHGRTIWVPPLHPYSTQFVAATLRCGGDKAEVMPLETQETFELGRSLTRGSECLPTALTIGTFLTAIKDNGPPSSHLLLMPTAQGPCRYGQYCTLHRQILDREGYEDVAILSPSSVNSYQGVAEEVRKGIFKGIVAGDILYKARCKTRPYEITAGDTEACVEQQLARVARTFEDGTDPTPAIAEAMAQFARIPLRGDPRPLVGVVGEGYVRNNAFSNEGLVEAIEDFGGEVWMAPFTEWMMWTSSPRNYRQYLDRLISKRSLSQYATYRWQKYWEHRLYRAAQDFLHDRHEPDIDHVMDLGMRYMEANIGGEALLTLGRTIVFAQQKAAMVVNCAPFGCMPGAVTTAIFREIAPELGIPVVNLYYDGNGNENKRLEVFLNNAIRA